MKKTIKKAVKKAVKKVAKKGLSLAAIAKIVALRAKGLTQTAISNKLKIPVTTVQYYLKKAK